MISDRDVRFYKEHGYLLVSDVLSHEQITALRADVEDIVAKAYQVTANNDVYDLEDSHSQQQPRVRRIKTPHVFLPSAGKLASDPKLVSILTKLIGPGVRLQTSKLNMKAAGYGAPVEWHQDWAFYPHTNDDLLAVGVMLDDVTSDNGALLVIPGTHTGPIYDHHADGFFCGAMDPETCGVDFSKAVALTGTAGSMTFHHVRLVHGSALNRSSRPRRLLLYQYTAVDAWPLVQPVTDIRDYDRLIVAGEATLTPRLAEVPVRIPLPPAPHQGSIYENQKGSGRRYFDTYQETEETESVSN
ncbi:MAG: phytanoyl-CoA dioxygenase family protein [Gammaproteobacteria bacterium]